MSARAERVKGMADAVCVEDEHKQSGAALTFAMFKLPVRKQKRKREGIATRDTGNRNKRTTKRRKRKFWNWYHPVCHNRSLH